jgi:hypothetical protein
MEGYDMDRKIMASICSSCKHSVDNQEGMILDFTKCEVCRFNAEFNVEAVMEEGLQNNHEVRELSRTI